MAEPQIRTVGEHRSKWGEGPIWWCDSLLYVDIAGHRLIRYNPSTGEETVHDVGEPIGTVVPTAGADLVYAGKAGFIRFDPATGEKTLLAANPEAGNRFNDGKCDPAGRFWAGTIDGGKHPTAALYRLDTDGTLTKKLSGITNSNGICWSADAATMYYIDTPTKKVRAYPYDQATGELGEPRDAVDTAALGYDSSPDGMTIDTDGMLWIAFCHGGCVARFDPAGGGKLTQIDLPASETTACAFGGRELDILYVTTGLKKDADEPGAGRLFEVRGLDAGGIPASPFRG